MDTIYSQQPTHGFKSSMRGAERFFMLRLFGIMSLLLLPLSAFSTNVVTELYPMISDHRVIDQALFESTQGGFNEFGDDYYMAQGHYCTETEYDKMKIVISRQMLIEMDAYNNQCITSGECANKPMYPVSMLIHGEPGEITGEQYIQWQKHFADKGIISVSIDYEELNERWSLAKNHAEARCATRWIREMAGQPAVQDEFVANPLGVDPENITVVGYSAGSLLAQSLLLAPADQNIKVCIENQSTSQEIPTYQARIMQGMGLAFKHSKESCLRVSQATWNQWLERIQPLESQWLIDEGVDVGKRSEKVHGGVLVSTVSSLLDVATQCSTPGPVFTGDNRAHFPLVTYHPHSTDSRRNAKADGEIYCGPYRDVQDAMVSLLPPLRLVASEGLVLPQAWIFRYLSLKAMGQENRPMTVGYRAMLAHREDYQMVVPLAEYISKDKIEKTHQLSPLSWIPELKEEERLPVLIMNGREDHVSTPWPGAVSLGMVLRQYGHVAETIILPMTGHRWEDLDGLPVTRSRNDVSSAFVKVIACSGTNNANCSSSIDPATWIEQKQYNQVALPFDTLDKYASTEEPRILLRPEASTVTRPHQSNQDRDSRDRLNNRYGANHNIYAGLSYRYDFHYVESDGRGWKDQKHLLDWEVLDDSGHLVPSLYEQQHELSGLARHQYSCDAIRVHPVLPGGTPDPERVNDLSPWCQFMLETPSDSVDQQKRYMITVTSPIGALSDKGDTVVLFAKPHPYADTSEGSNFSVSIRETSFLWWAFDQVDWKDLTSNYRPGGLVDVQGRDDKGHPVSLFTNEGWAPLGFKTLASFRRNAAHRYRTCFSETSICSNWKVPR